MSTVQTFQDRIVRPAEQVLITGRSLASIWRDQQAGNYPPSIRIGENAVGVRLSALMAWLDSREIITPENTKPVAPGRKTVGRPRKQQKAEV
ncbi:MAG: AlpA family phage regulatory protein [Desulfuromonadaceae bacterium]|nr:AlpA family phage regulatory protein [Desulfuromonadaceae bacterium]MDD2856699.1 AlpA family phage regulatory protein [Desulfuromonadaceae bacterium]